MALKPPKLNAGDTIGVVAPAHPFPNNDNKEYLEQYMLGRKEIENMGFRLKESKNLRKREWWRAGSPQERADDINAMYADPEVKAVIAHDGGNDCITVLEHLDYELVKKNPKPFIGFSNMTNIHSAFYTKANLVGFHMGLLSYELGWVWNQFAPNNKDKGSTYFKQVLTSDTAIGEVKRLTKWHSWRSGKAEGLLFGGNLSMIDSLMGTEYFPTISSLRDSIFFWELDNSPSYRVERVLTHLKYVGLFDVISGMLVGKLVDMKQTSINGMTEPSFKEIVLRCTNEYNFPILADVDFGHKMVQLPMPIGIKTSIDSEKLTMAFLEAAVV
ncbi:LD-carboxypeptidase [Candidatus Woesebacteria bacterium]|nr:MAG: LD-carboxypeptidase [Candidatus Woesebacteria bacterium]